MQNGLGTAGFVLGLVGLLFSFIPIIGVVAWPLTIIGLILAIIGFNRARAGRADNRGLAIAGIVLSAVGLAVCVLYAAVFTAAVGASDTAARSGGFAAATPSGDTAPQPFGQAVTVGDLSYSVSAPSAYSPSSSAVAGGPIARAVSVDITITNNGSAPFDFNSLAVNPKATAAGAAAPEITDFTKQVGMPQTSTVLPGKTITYQAAFAVPATPGDFQVEISSSMFGSPLVFTGTA